MSASPTMRTTWKLIATAAQFLAAGRGVRLVGVGHRLVAVNPDHRERQVVDHGVVGGVDGQGLGVALVGRERLVEREDPGVRGPGARCVGVRECSLECQQMPSNRRRSRRSSAAPSPPRGWVRPGWVRRTARRARASACPRWPSVSGPLPSPCRPAPHRETLAQGAPLVRRDRAVGVLARPPGPVRPATRASAVSAARLRAAAVPAVLRHTPRDDLTDQASQDVDDARRSATTSARIAMHPRQHGDDVALGPVGAQQVAHLRLEAHPGGGQHPRQRHHHREQREGEQRHHHHHPRVTTSRAHGLSSGRRRIAPAPRQRCRAGSARSGGRGPGRR